MWWLNGDVVAVQLHMWWLSVVVVAQWRCCGGSVDKWWLNGDVVAVQLYM
jgi:translation initiation factor IF-1